MAIQSSKRSISKLQDEQRIENFLNKEYGNIYSLGNLINNALTYEDRENEIKYKNQYNLAYVDSLSKTLDTYLKLKDDSYEGKDIIQNALDLCNNHYRIKPVLLRKLKAIMFTIYGIITNELVILTQDETKEKFEILKTIIDIKERRPRKIDPEREKRREERRLKKENRFSTRREYWLKRIEKAMNRINDKGGDFTPKELEKMKKYKIEANKNDQMEATN